jgi:hypothetical protein
MWPLDSSSGCDTAPTCWTRFLPSRLWSTSRCISSGNGEDVRGSPAPFEAKHRVLRQTRLLRQSPSHPQPIVELKIAGTKSAIYLTYVLTLTSFPLSDANRWIGSLLSKTKGFVRAPAAACGFWHRNFFPGTNSRAGAGCARCAPRLHRFSVGPPPGEWSVRKSRDPHGVCAVDPFFRLDMSLSKEGFACRSNP